MVTKTIKFSGFYLARLFEFSTKAWDEELVWGCFDEDEARLILDIPTATSQIGDGQCWNFTKDG